MANEYSRTERLADQIQRDLAYLLQREVKDPRVNLMSINEVKVSKDLGYADIYFTLITTAETSVDSVEVKDALKALKGAEGYLRSQLGSRIKMRIVPHLRFHFDNSVGRGRYLSSLIDKALNEDNVRAKDRDGE